MSDFDRKKLIEMVLYILEKTGGLDYYRIFKVLYFAERKHLAKWGSRFVPDDFCALPNGPVPTRLYDAVKRMKNSGKSDEDILARGLCTSVCFAGDDAPNVLLPNHLSNKDYFSMSEKEVLDESIRENARLSFSELKAKSHDAAWQEADAKGKGLKVISPLSMAKVLCSDKNMLGYIQEQMEISSILA